jgi:general stress protein 26
MRNSGKGRNHGEPQSADGRSETLRKFFDLVEDIEVAMMTTRSADGHLESRPMATQKRAAGADLWFVTFTRRCSSRSTSRCRWCC